MEIKLSNHGCFDLPNSIVQASERNQKNDKQGPEEKLIQDSLQAGLPHALGRSLPIILREPKLPTGYPDLVAVFLPTTLSSLIDRPSDLTFRHLQVLHHVYQSRGIGVSRLASDLLLSINETHRLLDELHNCDLIYWSRNSVRTQALAQIFLARRIIAIEAKVSNWQKALEQAHANTWFSSESYILLPEIRNIDLVVAEAAQKGIGLITYDGSHSRILLKSQTRKIPLSVGSWLIHERVIHSINYFYV